MAPPKGKKRGTSGTKPPVGTKRPRRGNQNSAEDSADDVEVTTPRKQARTKLKKSQVTEDDDGPGDNAVASTSNARRPTLGVKTALPKARGRGSRNKPSDGEGENTQHIRGKILGIIEKSHQDEALLIEDKGEASDDGNDSCPEDNLVTGQNGQAPDAVDPNQYNIHIAEDNEEGEAPSEGQEIFDEDDEPDGADGDTSKLRMALQDTSTFDDPSKSSDDWWLEDESRERILVDLWREERSLFDVSAKSYKTEDRNTILKRFSTILRVPREYNFLFISRGK